MADVSHVTNKPFSHCIAAQHKSQPGLPPLHELESGSCSNEPARTTTRPTALSFARLGMTSTIHKEQRTAHASIQLNLNQHCSKSAAQSALHGTQHKLYSSGTRTQKHGLTSTVNNVLTPTPVCRPLTPSRHCSNGTAQSVLLGPQPSVCSKDPPLTPIRHVKQNCKEGKDKFTKSATCELRQRSSAGEKTSHNVKGREKHARRKLNRANAKKHRSKHDADIALLCETTSMGCNTEIISEQAPNKDVNNQSGGKGSSSPEEQNESGQERSTGLGWICLGHGIYYPKHAQKEGTSKRVFTNGSFPEKELILITSYQNGDQLWDSEKNTGFTPGSCLSHLSRREPHGPWIKQHGRWTKCSIASNKNA